MRRRWEKFILRQARKILTRNIYGRYHASDADIRIAYEAMEKLDVFMFNKGVS
jgi:hypothetical protein